MRLLLDTSIVIGLMRGERAIDRKTRRIIDDAAAVFVSAASMWEIVIKASARELDVDVGRIEAGLLDTGVTPLAMTWTHALKSYDIAPFHPDPFDRLLLAQAICEPLHLLTDDRRLAQYGGGLVITA